MTEEGQKALLTFRTSDGRTWMAGASLTPLRSAESAEERGYRNGERIDLVDIRLVDVPEG